MTQSWSSCCWKLGLASSLAIGGAIASEDCTFAQVTPDATLEAESSVITPNVVINGIPSDQIDGGAVRGANLFHSFGEFNVGEGRGVYFTNPAGIENILTRVTGKNPSNLLGKLGVLGNANLFLINPNGIIFGAEASLDVGGSFVATTANTIGFNNQGFFSASAPNVPPVLTVNPSALLFNQITAGSITNNSREPAGQRLNPAPSAPSRVRSLFGLRVPDDRSLLLVGGNVSLNGGGLNALGGRVELGGLAGAGVVGLNVNGNNLNLNFPDAVQRADVSLTDGATVDASGEGGGNIQVQGKRIILSGGSQIAANTLGSKSGGTLAVTASDSVEMTDFTPSGTLTTQTRGAGDAGDVTINTEKLIVQNGANVLTATYDKGAGGELTITAPDFVKLIGTSPDGRVNSGLFSSTGSAGDAGNITLNTGRLIVRDGAAVSAESTAQEDPFGRLTIATGRGGNLNLNATDSVQLTGSFVNTSSVGFGDAGNLTLNTGRLIVQNGGKISTATYGLGKGGTLDVNASNSVELSGSSVNGNSPSSLFTSTDSNTYSSFFPSTEGTGDAGKLTIETGQLTVQDGAEVSVSSVGSTSGNAGDLEVKANSIRLDNGGKFTATSESSKGGGNITLKNQNLLLLRGRSEISTDARRGGGKGGDITIDTGILTAIENSNITARAVEGQGGNIRITTQGLFRSPDSTINATSEQGIDGVVEINRPDIDPSADLVVLPAQIVDVSGLVAQSCPASGGSLARGGSEFVVSGRGGLPPTPAEATRSDTTLADLGTPVQSQYNRLRAAIPSNSTEADSVPIVEAQSWMIGAKGEVVLTALAPTVTPDIPWLTSTSCNRS